MMYLPIWCDIWHIKRNISRFVEYHSILCQYPGLCVAPPPSPHMAENITKTRCIPEEWVLQVYIWRSPPYLFSIPGDNFSTKKKTPPPADSTQKRCHPGEHEKVYMRYSIPPPCDLYAMSTGIHEPPKVKQMLGVLSSLWTIQVAWHRYTLTLYDKISPYTMWYLHVRYDISIYDMISPYTF